MGKPTICICENKDVDQLRSNCKADQCLCFRNTDSTMSDMCLAYVEFCKFFNARFTYTLMCDCCLRINPNPGFSVRVLN